jgi:hypothetical protein
MYAGETNPTLIVFSSEAWFLFQWICELLEQQIHSDVFRQQFLNTCLIMRQPMPFCRKTVETIVRVAYRVFLVTNS